MLTNHISFTVEAKNNETEREKYCQCDVLVNYKGVLFDPEESADESSKVRIALLDKYWKLFDHLRKDFRAIAKISGIDFDTQRFINSYLCKSSPQNNIIYHYHHWRSHEENVFDEDTFAIIECKSNDLLRDIFEKYWFPIKTELQLEIFILPEVNITAIEQWSRLDNNEEKRESLYNMTVFIIDNMHNGFHFRIISNKENSSYFEEHIVL